LDDKNNSIQELIQVEDYKG